MSDRAEVLALAEDIVAARRGADRARQRRFKRTDDLVRAKAKEAQRRAVIAGHNPMLTSAERHEAVTVAASLLLLVAALDLAKNPKLRAKVSA